ncbi:MAG: hypothetical protein ACRC7O_17135, partial [Fimbriiglobus sp.]
MEKPRPARPVRAAVVFEIPQDGTEPVLTPGRKRWNAVIGLAPIGLPIAFLLAGLGVAWKISLDGDDDFAEQVAKGSGLIALIAFVAGLTFIALFGDYYPSRILLAASTAMVDRRPDAIVSPHDQDA